MELQDEIVQLGADAQDDLADDVDHLGGIGVDLAGADRARGQAQRGVRWGDV